MRSSGRVYSPTNKRDWSHWPDPDMQVAEPDAEKLGPPSSRQRFPLQLFPGTSSEQGAAIASRLLAYNLTEWYERSSKPSQRQWKQRGARALWIGGLHAQRQPARGNRKQHCIANSTAAVRGDGCRSLRLRDHASAASVRIFIPVTAQTLAKPRIFRFIVFPVPTDSDAQVGAKFRNMKTIAAERRDATKESIRTKGTGRRHNDKPLL
jgi:hypothetical protein